MSLKIKYLIFITIILLSSCNDNKNNKQVIKEDNDKALEQLTFYSSDVKLEETFVWAKKTALSYVGNSNDLVGPWYEGALPAREAFCMRDISHQCLAAEYLGLHKENLNMMKKFVGNIAESRDWCSFWEINRYNKPAPVDYKNDEEFWYNLPANFDVMQACYRLYMLSGDETYIKDPLFLNFYNKTVTEYIDRWQLNVEDFANRDKYLNVTKPVKSDYSFHYARGLASYIEGGRDLKIGVDLIAAIYSGLNVYANILEINGNNSLAQDYREKAKLYKKVIEENFWDEKENSYYSFVTYNGEYHSTEPATFLLWFNAIDNPQRLEGVLNQLERKTYNIENTSYLPYIQYKYGRKEMAYKTLNFLSNITTKRRDYPEVSYGVVQAMVDGLMGIKIDFISETISIKPSLSDNTKWAEIQGLPIADNSISVKHYGNNKAEIQFRNKSNFSLKVVFDASKYSTIFVNNEKVDTIIDNNLIIATIKNIDNKLMVIEAK